MPENLPAGLVLAAPTKLLVSGAAAFEARVREALAGKPSNLVIDLSGTAYVDSVGLGALIRALRAAREYGGTVTLRRPQPAVLNVLQITDTIRRFDVENENA